MSDKTSHIDVQIPQQQPGQLLKQAREKLGMEQKDIASQLNLQTEIIIAVEDDAADRLPAPTYVRGYIRSYARIVHLDADALIKLYENDAAAPPEIIPDIKSSSQINSDDKPVKAVTYLVTFGLALLLIAWLQSHYVVNQTEQGQKTTPAEQDSNPQSAPETDASDYNAATILESYSETELISGMPLPEQMPGTEMTVDLISDMDLPDTAGTNPVAGNVTVTGEQSDPTLVSPADQIIFKVSKDSWIEVYDSGNNRLYLGLAKSGEEINLSGVAPFNVLLGYSPGVEVTFNGDKFDTDPHSKSGIAKFVLGEQESRENIE